MGNFKTKIGSLVAFSFVASLSLAGLSACKKEAEVGSAKAPTELRVFTWSDYLKDDVVKEFEKENNAKVKLDFFSSNEELLAKLQASVQAGGAGYDVIFPSDYMAGNMIQLKLLQNLDKTKLPFLSEFDPAFLHPAYDSGLTYVVPFAWGTTGIAVNTKLAKDFDLSKGVSWKDILENPKYAGKVTMLDDAKEALHAALIIGGVKWANATESDVQNAFAYLKKHKKNLKIFTAQTRPVIEADECVLCQVYSGDAMQVHKIKNEVDYLIPREGATIWTDNMAVPTNAAHPELAFAFMTKMLSAQGAKKFMEATFFGSPNEKSRELLADDLKKNLGIFPNKETFSKLAYLNERPELLPLIDRLWTELKTE